MEQPEFFGNVFQIELQRKCYRLWPTLKAHPRLSFVGRGIGLDDPELDDVATIAGLTKELGFLSLPFTRASIVDRLHAALEEHGLRAGLWQHLVSDQETEARSLAVVEESRLPPGYRIDHITPATPRDLLRNFQELMQRCDVAPQPGYILRGLDVPAIAEMVLNQQDEVVSCGVGILRHNPNGPHRKAVHVGSLATDPGERGNGFARLLLARIIVTAYQEHAAEFLYTGVRAENIASQRVCRSCGLVDSTMYFVGVAYPPLLEQERFTS